MIVAYKGMGPERGNIVPAEDALSYAMERCGIQPSTAPANSQDRDEFSRMLVEWFFSGNWAPVEKDEEADSECIS